MAWTTPSGPTFGREPEREIAEAGPDVRDGHAGPELEPRDDAGAVASAADAAVGEPLDGEAEWAWESHGSIMAEERILPDARARRPAENKTFTIGRILTPRPSTGRR